MGKAGAPLTLADLLEGVEVLAANGGLEVPVRAVQHDSRLVEPGDVFFALNGARYQGLDFVDDVLRRGAVAVVAEELASLTVPVVQVQDLRRALALASAAAAGHPTRAVPTVGITGTNGKTTTSYVFEAVSAALGRPAGVIGTIDMHYGELREVPGFTTPEAPELQRFAARAVDAGAQALVLEVTSHALSMRRTTGCTFRAVAFSNLTQDHLDLHGSMEAYGATKLRLFQEELAASPEAVAVVNIDDPWGAHIAQVAACPVITVSAEGQARADLRVVQRSLSLRGIEARIELAGRPLEVRCPLVGQHNLANILLTLGIVDALGWSVDQAAEVLPRLAPVPGRLETIPDPRGNVVLVDYAHTPDALERVTEALRPVTRGRLIVLFGCGGNRDQTKRPLMGAAAATCADVVVVTSDNPRREEPQSIIDMILPGVHNSGLPRVELGQLAETDRGYAVEPDRRSAIRGVLAAVRPEDVVLIAGKGHEPYQILGETKIHFDDREEAREAIAAITAGACRRGGNQEKDNSKKKRS